MARSATGKERSRPCHKVWLLSGCPYVPMFEEDEQRKNTISSYLFLFPYLFTPTRKEEPNATPDFSIS